ncbi:MAG: hypothetical protein IJW31_09370 [Lentisphaeria bacterium]|nr:hypothetical protein [Lentisphaeria bacterium]
MKKFLILIVGILLLSGFGCMRVDYVGQKFPILPEGEYVDFYRSLDEVPDNLKPIGRGTAMVPFTMIDDDIYLLFAEKAAEVGATAFAISDSQKVLLGATNEIESRPRRPDAAWSVDGTDGEGRAVYSNTFGREEGLKVVTKTHYKLKLTAVFYVPIESFNEYLNSSNAAVEAEEATEEQKTADFDAETIASEDASK